jgi:hypothetical protein
MKLVSIFLQATTGALETFSGFVITAVNVIFIIVLAIGLINTVRKFIVNDPAAMGSLGQLIVGVIVFLGFNLLRDDLLGIFGGFAG